MIKIHLDTDLGGDTDDLCALTMLLKWPDIQILGVTTNTENNGKRAGYTKYALNVAEKDNIPVKAGADVKDGFYRGQPGLPNESDYWPEPVDSSPNTLDEALELVTLHGRRFTLPVASFLLQAQLDHDLVFLDTEYIFLSQTHSLLPN